MFYKKVPFFSILFGTLIVLFALAVCSLVPSAPRFSVQSGFFDEPFFLKLSGNGTIFYTLDGSLPTEKSLKYEGAIEISEATQAQGNLIDRKDVSGLDALGMHTFYPERNDFPAATVVNARSFYNGRWSDVSTNTFFVGQDERYREAKIISLIMDPSSLVGKDGIYINGSEYDDRISNRNDIESVVLLDLNGETGQVAG